MFFFVLFHSNIQWWLAQGFSPNWRSSLCLQCLSCLDGKTLKNASFEISPAKQLGWAPGTFTSLCKVTCKKKNETIGKQRSRASHKHNLKSWLPRETGNENYATNNEGCQKAKLMTLFRGIMMKPAGIFSISTCSFSPSGLDLTWLFLLQLSDGTKRAAASKYPYPGGNSIQLWMTGSWVQMFSFSCFFSSHSWERAFGIGVLILQVRWQNHLSHLGAPPGRTEFYLLTFPR